MVGFSFENYELIKIPSEKKQVKIEVHSVGLLKGESQALGISFAKSGLELDITNNLEIWTKVSLEKNLFKGLDKESTLKYEYFFPSIPDNYIKDENKFLEIFKSDFKSICSYDFSKANEKEFKSFLNNYFKTRSSTPKTKVEAINPTPINPAMIAKIKYMVPMSL